MYNIIAALATSPYIVGSNSVYATARSTATSHYQSAYGYVGQSYFLSAYIIYRYLLRFDTSVLPPGYDITRAYLRMYLASMSNDDGDYDIEIVKHDWSGQDPVDAGNRDTAYDGCLAGTKDVIWQNTSALTEVKYYNSEDLDVTWINPAGYTYYSLRSSNDFNASVPSGSNYIWLGATVSLMIDSCPLPEIYQGSVAFV